MSSENPEPFAPSTPAGIPEAGLAWQSAPLSQAKFVVLMAAQVLYAIVCVVGIVAVSHQASLANRLVQGDTTVTLDQANASDNSVGTITLFLIVAFVFLLVALLMWQRNLNRALGKDRVRALLRRFGLRYVWLIWSLLWVVGSVTSVGSQSDPQALVSADHRTMFLLGARAVLLLVISALTVVTVKRARQELGQVPAPQPFAPLS
jgi:hypothetical protein